MSAQWKKFEGTQDQLDEMRDAEHGWIVRFKSGDETFPEKGEFSDNFNLIVSKGLIDQYLICDPLPHAEMIARHAMTGQPVYFFKEVNECWKTTSYPTWLEQIKYSFNPPREKEFIEVREYVWRNSSGHYNIGIIENNSSYRTPEEVEKFMDFIKWIDQDWRKIEI